VARLNTFELNGACMARPGAEGPSMVRQLRRKGAAEPGTTRPSVDRRTVHGSDQTNRVCALLASHSGPRLSVFAKPSSMCFSMRSMWVPWSRPRTGPAYCLGPHAKWGR
jgi:hypothetical protein